MPSEALTACPFCAKQIESKIIEMVGSAAAVADVNPVTEGHVLIIPVRHTPDFFTMTAGEKEDALKLIDLLCDKIKRSDQFVTGFNIGTNCGVSAGQTIMHAHIHLVPRRDGDTPKPRGGVRGVIPDRMSY